MTKVFIDGSAGTTGLRIAERLATRRDLALITLSEERRKDPAARAAALNEADIAFLCLPDAAAIEAVGMVQNRSTAVIDTSTAHRTAPGWVYGFPELDGRRSAVASSNRIANPGCHASGFLALTAPLVKAGLLPPDAALTCFSLTGYSGGGKKMIADYEADGRDPLLKAPRQYGLAQSHKHLPEMTAVSGLTVPPAFCPVVADFYSGMEVTVPLFAHQLKGTRADVLDVYRQTYTGPVVRLVENADESGFWSAAAFSGRDDMQITVAGNDERLLLCARFDNLGKGASGAAIQNMNIRLGLEETTGLIIGG
ncbi:MAG: N-acetyl-gamma-glutamyl-phosphate reductase [Acutalibacteraceae bacterium]